MKTDLLINLVVEYYEDEDIETAKKLLFENFPSHRNVKRKSKNKNEINLKDILELMHSLPEQNHEQQPLNKDSDSLVLATTSCNFPSLDILFE